MATKKKTTTKYGNGGSKTRVSTGTNKGSKLTYKDKFKKPSSNTSRYSKVKSVRLEEAPDGTYYKSKAKGTQMGKASDRSLASNKKEISQNKYNRNKKRINKAASKGATTEFIKNTPEYEADKKAKQYPTFKKAADSVLGEGAIINPTKYPDVDRGHMNMYNAANTVNKMNPMKFFREGAETRKAKMLESARKYNK
jgi:hypothetical protein